MKPYQFFIIMIFFYTSCVEEFDLKLNNSEQRVVIEGLITDSAELSYVRVTLSNNSLSYNRINSWLDDGATPINTAFVTITDDMGNIDTMVAAPEFVIKKWIDYHDSLRIDTVANDFYYQKGYYFLSKMKPTPKHTYYLSVTIDNRLYKAQCYMPALPEVDSISFRFSSDDKSDYYIPLIYFKEPKNEENYYLFTTGESMANVWQYSILSDKYLSSYVNGVDVFRGQTNLYWRNAYPFPGTYYYISMQSLTKEAYEYYDCLIKLFSNDGGTYKPTPASPISNINNNALGFFRASSVKIFTGQLP
ncbi:MAG: DUF4249 domain-containing protein [Bacteroidales bacterium]|nr:DUF4249 domain-containing protein [Bacteroidales bacterium]